MSTEEKVKLKEAEKLVGKFVVLWRNESKQPCKVLEVYKDKEEVLYELIGGPDKGKKIRSRYDSTQTIRAYDEGSSLLVLLET